VVWLVQALLELAGARRLVGTQCRVQVQQFFSYSLHKLIQLNPLTLSAPDGTDGTAQWRLALLCSAQSG
jgi:hypothetical protein